MSPLKIVVPLAAAAALAPHLACAAEPDVLHLALGDPARSGREAPLVLDAITDTHGGELLAPGELAPRLEGVRLLFVGETHTSMDDHRVQLRVIEELTRAGREVLIGLEMYPYTAQEHLDHWSQGLLTEEGFLRLSHWYHNWGYPWGYYRDIFLFARDHGLSLYAVNAPRDVIAAVRRKGFADLSPEEAAYIPTTVDTDSEDHRNLFRALLGDGEGMHSTLSDEQLDAMYSAQCTWDATMAFNAVGALEEHGGEGSILVLLVGGGHLAYGLGIQRQAARFFDGSMATLLPVPVEDDTGQAVEAVQASYADLLWGLPPETAPAFPSLGASTSEVEDEPHRRVIFVTEGSVAERAGFTVGDVLLSMDGEPVPDKETLSRLLASKRWGDSALFTVRRGEETVELEAFFRRRPPAAESPEAP